MVELCVADDELEAVRELVQHADNAQLLRRAQAIFWLASGDDVGEVARRLCVSRATVYNWIARFEQRADLDVASRLENAKRSGRPRTASGIIDPLIANVIDEDPRDLGFRQTVWTADLLVTYLKRAHGIEVSIPSIRLAVDRLGIAWKRPRHELARRPRYWRQAKGGSRGASGAGSGPSS